MENSNNSETNLDDNYTLRNLLIGSPRLILNVRKFFYYIQYIGIQF